ncbi:MCE family protein [Solirubrobacter sp. CPCC 204708]|uniref:MCE family protein n=1 Tax=Solirubrobacter deserti TaxID=2282478 RepID=A0ABT4RG94_9ACTN|nr:MlaD family protein [Solirubrobacter deserti]MBE2318222.1 MCE family protein [Solirubrobacter deserti]MDA0137503.1 MCE family protein [Solirubrobacter deserti]
MARTRRHGPRRSNAFIGLLAVAVIAVIMYFGFTKDIPLKSGFELRAQFQSANSIRPNSPVRIAGVEVGKVKAVEPVEGSNDAMLVMELKDSALPLHENATAKIRPRIFLEGNFFVDLKPGTPGSPQLESGDMIAVTQTASPVQLDEILTSLQADSREDLTKLLKGLNTTLTSEPTEEQDADSHELAQGETAAESFNDALDDIPAAERSTAQVLEALMGTQPTRDINRLIRGTARTAEELSRYEQSLQDLITNLNTTTAALAGESANLRASIRELPPTLAAANSAFDALNAAFPPTRAFATEIRPGVRETPATIEAAFPWIEQTRALVQPEELGGLAAELSPATVDLARLIDRATELLPQVDLLSRCVRDVVLPAGDLVVQDEFTNGEENYKEFFYALVGIAGEGQNFDGNGMYVRFQTGGGSQTLSLGPNSTSLGELFGNFIEAPLGNRPAMPPKKPTYRDDVPCHTQTLPNVNGPLAGKTAPGGGPTAAAARTKQDKLRKATELKVIRRKLNPFGAGK